MYWRIPGNNSWAVSSKKSWKMYDFWRNLKTDVWINYRRNFSRISKKKGSQKEFLKDPKGTPGGFLGNSHKKPHMELLEYSRTFDRFPIRAARGGLSVEAHGKFSEGTPGALPEEFLEDAQMSIFERFSEETSGRFSE